MASEYLKWKARNEKPAPPPPPMTKKEKLLNWLYYNKLYLIAAAVLIWIVGSMLWSALGIGQVKPDYTFAYIGGDELPDASASALEAAFASLGKDVNGDGRVVIELRQYATNRSGEAETAMYYNLASNTQLLADITAADSYFFLVEDPRSVQRSYQIFARADGTPPDEDDFNAMDKVFLWSDCPVLAELDVEQKTVENLYFGRRCFYDEKQAGEQEANDAFWQVLTKGA